MPAGAAAPLRPLRSVRSVNRSRVILEGRHGVLVAAPGAPIMTISPPFWASPITAASASAEPVASTTSAGARQVGEVLEP